VARLDAMPSLAIIDGLKRTLDFYYWMGIPCVRSWPRSPGHKRAPAVEAQWAPFSFAAKEWSNLTDVVKDAYTQMALGTALTPRDWQIKAYLEGLYRYDKP